VNKMTTLDYSREEDQWYVKTKWTDVSSALWRILSVAYRENPVFHVD